MSPDRPYFRLLGPLDIRWRDQPVALKISGRSKPACLLAVLLNEPEQPVTRRDVDVRIWGKPVTDDLRWKCVSQLREALRLVEVSFQHSGDAYQLTVRREDVDIHRFDGLVAQANAAAAREPATAVAALREALAMWRGTALAGLHSVWLDNRRAELAGRHLAARLLLLRLELAQQPTERLASDIAELHADHPANQDAALLAMTALLAVGDDERALQVYEQTATHLLRQYKKRPSPALDELKRQIERQPVGASAEIPASQDALPSPPVPIPRHLPAALPNFSGRRSALGLLNGVLDRARPTQAARVVVIDGEAGVGKTALAIHWAHQVASTFPEGQLYLDLQGFGRSGKPLYWAEAIRHVLVGLGAEPRRIPLDETERLNEYRTALAQAAVLLVLDNAANAEQVRPLIPASSAALVLVTSRRMLEGLLISHGAATLSLQLPDGEEARELLGAHLDGNRVATEPAAADEIVRLCGRLPLALAIAGARAEARPRSSLEALAHELSVGLVAFSTGDEATSVKGVLDWSYRELSSPSQQTLRLLGVHPGPEVDAIAVASLAGTDERVARECLAELSAVRLIVEREGRFGFHDLIRDYANGLAADLDARQRADAKRRMFDHYLYTADACATHRRSRRQPTPLDPPAPGVLTPTVATDAQAGAWFQTEHPVLLRLIRDADAAGLPGHGWRLLATMADYFDWSGRWDDWIASARIAASTAEDARDLPGVARARRSLGRALGQTRQYAEADTELRAALAIYETLADTDGQTRVHHDLGALYDQQGRNHDALSEVREALRLCEATEGRPERGNILGAAAWCYAQHERYEDALDFCVQAIAEHRQQGYVRGEAAALDTLGVVQHKLGRISEALTNLDRAKQLCRQVGDLPGTAAVEDHLGDCLWDTGRTNEAVQAWERAIAVLLTLRNPHAAAVRRKVDQAQ